ncbi:Autism Susceptibility 2 Protein [Manis pentadactyla]|nr:Autism Susceptibility 2 Protein [Manis pentadactyla]
MAEACRSPRCLPVRHCLSSLHDDTGNDQIWQEVSGSSACLRVSAVGGQMTGRLQRTEDQGTDLQSRRGCAPHTKWGLLLQKALNQINSST